MEINLKNQFKNTVHKLILAVFLFYTFTSSLATANQNSTPLIVAEESEWLTIIPLNEKAKAAILSEYTCHNLKEKIQNCIPYRCQAALQSPAIISEWEIGGIKEDRCEISETRKLVRNFIEVNEISLQENSSKEEQKTNDKTQKITKFKNKTRMDAENRNNTKLANTIKERMEKEAPGVIKQAPGVIKAKNDLVTLYEPMPWTTTCEYNQVQRNQLMDEIEAVTRNKPARPYIINLLGVNCRACRLDSNTGERYCTFIQRSESASNDLAP